MSTESATTADPITTADHAANPLAAEAAKSPKSSKVARYIGVGAVLLVFAVGLWAKAAKLSTAQAAAVANTHCDQGVSLYHEAAKKFHVFEKDTASFPQNRAELERRGREIAAIFGRSAEEYRLAAAKITEAGKTTIDIDVRNYLQGKASAYHKSAERCDLFQTRLLSVADPEIHTMEELKAKQKVWKARDVTLANEWVDLEEAANKVRMAHRHKFQ